MKQTKNMIYVPSTESTELTLFVENERSLYDSMTLPIIKNLKRKKAKGIYNPSEAVKLWYNLATKGSELYNKYYGYSFTVTERWTTATDLEEFYREEMDSITF